LSNKKRHLGFKRKAFDFSLVPVPGFGPDVSAKVIGALGNPFRFQNRDPGSV
jgi:hypothetical protein